MKAIIIQDTGARALLDQLLLESMPVQDVIYIAGAKPEEYEDFNRRYAAWIKETRKEFHRKFHYVVCRWLQEQGASVVR